ncbi:MAG: MoxR family ATPase, partial [Planctomycetota bacterium]
VDQHGTYPLPEAQLDRFAMKLSVGYPGREHELDMLEAAIGETADTPGPVDPVFAAGELSAVQKSIAAIAVAPSIRDYIVRLGEATRTHRLVELGLSPRGLLTLQRAEQAKAALSHRDFVTPDDVQDVAEPVLGVRLGVDGDDSLPVVREIRESVEVPTEG